MFAFNNFLVCCKATHPLSPHAAPTRVTSPLHCRSRPLALRSCVRLPQSQQAFYGTVADSGNYLTGARSPWIVGAKLYFSGVSLVFCWPFRLTTPLHLCCLEVSCVAVVLVRTVRGVLFCTHHTFTWNSGRDWAAWVGLDVLVTLRSLI